MKLIVKAWKSSMRRNEGKIRGGCVSNALLRVNQPHLGTFKGRIRSSSVRNTDFKKEKTPENENVGKRQRPCLN